MILRAGATQRIARLFAQHRRLVAFALQRRRVPPALIEDALQEVYLVVCRRIESIAAESERAFLLSTAHHVASHYRRSAAISAARLGTAQIEADSVPSEASDPATLLDEKRSRRHIQRVLETLPPEHRTAYVLFEFEGYRVREISAVVGAPPATVASRLHSARAVVRRGLHWRSPLRNSIDTAEGASNH